VSDRKRGRPPKPEGERRQHVGVRVAPAIRAQLEAAAAESGRSLSQEIELRLAQSFERDQMQMKPDTAKLLHMIATEIAHIESITRKSWHKDLTTWAAVAESFVQGPILRVRPDKTDEDEFVNGAWEKINQARFMKQPLVDYMREHGIQVDLVAPAIRHRLNRRPGLFGNALAQFAYPEDRRQERAQIENSETLTDEQKDGLLATLNVIEKYDRDEIEADKEFGEALAPFQEAESKGRDWYRQDRSRRALADYKRGESINWDEVRVWPSHSPS
jgi:hypothetical protein